MKVPFLCLSLLNPDTILKKLETILGKPPIMKSTYGRGTLLKLMGEPYYRSFTSNRNTNYSLKYNVGTDSRL